MKKAGSVHALRKCRTIHLQKVNDSQLSRFSSQKQAASNNKKLTSPKPFNRCTNPRNNNPNPANAIPATEVITSVSTPIRCRSSGRRRRNKCPVVKKYNQAT
jgi:hypothetical protein